MPFLALHRTGRRNAPGDPDDVPGTVICVLPDDVPDFGREAERQFVFLRVPDLPFPADEMPGKVVDLDALEAGLSNGDRAMLRRSRDGLVRVSKAETLRLSVAPPIVERPEVEELRESRRRG